MKHQFLSDFLKMPTYMALKEMIQRLERIQIPEAQLSEGVISYKVEGNTGTYEVKFFYPKTWNVLPAENFLGGYTSASLFQQRGEKMPELGSPLVGFVKRPIYIWHIWICLKFEPKGGGLVSDDLINEMLDIITQKLQYYLK